MTNTRFFFVGSLTQGMVHFSKIESLVESIENASIKAAAYRLRVGFPVLVSEGQDLVPGQMVELRTSDLLLHLLDEFHGVNTQQPEKSLYFRQMASVICDDGQIEDVWVYFANPQKLPADARLIDGGDWKHSLEQTPSMIANLTERQSTYIQRLGKATGREIVPIDLPLYRELMNLELIVDKGRRLALSKLGQEVYRYLG